jgi:phage shock protein A
MNLFGRIFRVFRSYANSVVGGAEDPEKILDQAVNEMQSDLIKMRQSSAQVLASQKQIEAKYNQSRDTAEEWLKRAELALAKGDEELAREALKRKKAFQDNAATMKAQVDAQKKATDQLISNTRMLESKLNEAKSKKNTLKARAKSAQTTRQINEMIQGLNLNNSMAAFDRMEEKVMALESESEATLQLSASDNLEDRFKKLEGNDVDDELAQLKRGQLKSGSNSSSKSSSNALPEGRPIRDAIDWELEELRRKSS